MNKCGWIKIVEAFTAIMLIMVVVIIVIDKDYAEKKDISKNIYETEIELLKEIIDRFENLDENEINDLILGEGKYLGEKRIPDYLDCIVKICGINDKCKLLEDSEDRDVYVQTALILKDGEDKQLKVFCWVK